MEVTNRRLVSRESHVKYAVENIQPYYITSETLHTTIRSKDKKRARMERMKISKRLIHAVDLLRLEVWMENLDENNTISLPEVLCRPSIPVSKNEIPTQEDADRWQYLQGYVYLPTINSDVELLIGANVPQALQPKQIIGS